MGRCCEAIRRFGYRLSLMGEERTDMIQDWWNKWLNKHSCFGIRVMEFAVILAVVSLTIGIASLTLGLCTFSTESIPLLLITCMGIHRIVIAVTLIALVRFPGRRMAAVHLANDFLHFFLTATSITVTSIELASHLLPYYRLSMEKSSCWTTVPPRFPPTRLPVNTISLYLEIISMTSSIVGLAIVLRFRSYIIARQRYDMARATRDEIFRVYRAETHPELPRPPVVCRRRAQSHEARSQPYKPNVSVGALQ